jgi:ABC-type thiamine transport system substrate-binding protein
LTRTTAAADVEAGVKAQNIANIRRKGILERLAIDDDNCLQRLACRL